MFMFGLVTVFQGLVQTWGGLMATRFFLGVFETGMFPGCFYLMGMWYKRSEAQKRFSLFFSSTTLAGAFGGLLATAIGNMDGLGGYHGWRWIFILEGILTCVVASVWFFVIPDFPEEVNWLNEEERTFIKAKLAKDVGKSAYRIKSLGLQDILDVFRDYKIFIGGLMYFGLIVPAYGYAYFAPTIIKSYGYDTAASQLYSIPPWAAAFVFCMLIAITSDRLRHRFLFALIPICITIAGFVMLLSIHGQAHRNILYGALFLVTCGCFSAMPVVICWFTMNLSGHKRRSIGSAWQLGFGNIGGIIATYSFLSQDAPNYHPGYSTCISFLCLSGASCIVYLLAIFWENSKRQRVRAATNPETVIASAGVNDDGEDEFLGDLAPSYRYIY
jgi:MFS family permease